MIELVGGALLAILGLLGVGRSLWKRREQTQAKLTKVAPTISAKGIQETLDKQEPIAKPRTLPIPHRLTKEELEKLAEED